MSATPGPWTLMAGMPTNVLDAGGMRVARCDFDGDFDSPEAHANARLIAAAPALLAALTALLKTIRSEMPPFEAGREAQVNWAEERATARKNAESAIALASPQQP